MPKGGKLAIRAYKEGKDALIIVQDNDVAFLIQWEENYLLQYSPQNRKGLGLAVIKRMTEALGGTVSFESQVGKGTTFIVRLPQRDKR
jgi:light-regulated signal transduction histidine kinase (bacteriophytochrome)